MLVQDLLLGTLEDLDDAAFHAFKWHLSHRVLEECPPIPKARLEHAQRTDTVDRLTECYGERLAVSVTTEVLRKMRNNLAAEQLAIKYSERSPECSPTRAPPSAAATPVSISAQGDSLVIAPIVAGGTSGTWNISINK